jgi:hypothetical protein
MAFDKKIWDRAKVLFESGLSLREISNETGIAHTSIFKKSSANGWGKNISKTTTKTDECKKGYIYLITTDTDEPFYKIGLAVDVGARLKSMQSGNPNKLIVKGAYFTKNMYSEEKYWHNKFLDKQHFNEWFKLDYEEIEDFLSYCNDDLLNYVYYLQDLLKENKITFKGKEWLN